MCQLSKVLKDLECSGGDYSYGVIVDLPSQIPPKWLKEISFLARKPKSTEMVTDDDTIDTMLAFSRYGVNVILEIPFDGREIVAKNLMSLFSQFNISLSPLPPENPSENLQNQYISLMDDFVNVYISDMPLNFKATLFPISNYYEDLIASHFAGKNISSSSSHRYIVERFQQNMSPGFAENVEKHLKKSIINRFFDLLRNDDGTPFETPEDAFAVYGDTMASCILNKSNR